jgi:hypothetical protein
MSTQHTPGPWTYTPHGAGESGCLIRAARQTIVAEAWPVAADGQQSANAALIASAPELLARLESLLFDLDAIGYADEDDEVSGAECVDVCSQHIESIRAAIAKATGA